MGHGAFRGVLIGVGLIVFVIFGFSVVLGGAGLFADSKLNARASQIEAQMLAELPADMPPEQREAMKEKTKILARKAAELEASGLIGKNSAAQMTAATTAKSATAATPLDRAEQHYAAPSNFDSGTTNNVDAGVHGKEWKFGDPSAEIK
jgi:uncharacterized membrane protein